MTNTFQMYLFHTVTVSGTLPSEQIIMFCTQWLFYLALYDFIHNNCTQHDCSLIYCSLDCWDKYTV